MFTVVVVIAIISVIGAIWSLRGQKDFKTLKGVKEELSKGRVVYQDERESSEDSSESLSSA